MMSEEDYKRLQEYIAQVYARTEHNDKVEAQMGEESNALRGALETCKERQRKWKTKDGR